MQAFPGRTWRTMIVAVAMAVLFVVTGGANGGPSCGGGHLPTGVCGHHVPSALRGFLVLVMADLGAPHNKYNIKSVACWAAAEGGSATWNPLDTTFDVPGHQSCFNTINGVCGVRNYDSESVGANATAQTIANWYGGIYSALKNGYGVCGGGLSADFNKWSDGGYGSVC